jgi:hypothetical protein
MVTRKMRDRLLKPAIDHRRLGQFLTGDWVKNIPALTLVRILSPTLVEVEPGLITSKYFLFKHFGTTDSP